MATSLVQGCWRSQRVCPDPVRDLARSSWSKNNMTEVSCAVEAFTNGIWTATKFIEAGYLEVDPMCQLCHEPEDSIDQKHFGCMHDKVKDLRNKFGKAYETINEARSKDTFFA